VAEAAAMGELDAWGGLAVSCGGASANVECASQIVDGSHGRAGYCMWLPAGAVGGAVPADGTYCACAKFRGGSGCGTVEPSAYVFAAVQAGLALVNAWVVAYALRTRMAVVATAELGARMSAMLKVLTLVGASAACLVSAFTCQILMAVAPLPFISAWSAYDVASSAAVALMFGAAGTLSAEFRAVTHHAEGRSARAWEARAADVFAIVSFVCVLAAPTSNTKTVAIFGLGTLVAISLLTTAYRVRGLIDHASSLDLAACAMSGERADPHIQAALRRIMRFLNIAGFFLSSFVIIRVTRMTTSTKGQAPVQGRPVVFFARELLNVLYYLAVALLLAIPVCTYVGGPARERLAARKSRTVSVAPSVTRVDGTAKMSAIASMTRSVRQ
jgi:hypothetical protein